LHKSLTRTHAPRYAPEVLQPTSKPGRDTSARPAPTRGRAVWDSGGRPKLRSPPEGCLAPWSLNCTGPSAVRRPGNPGSRGLSCAPIISQRPLKPTKAETVASRLMLCYPMLTNSCRVDCFGHASFVTVISRASLPMACVPCVSGKGNAIPRFLFLMFTGCKRDGHHSGEWDWVGQNLAAHNSTTNP
jgi:hypothetical protein